LVYVNAMVARISYDSSLTVTQLVYAQYDANFNVTSLVDANTGAVAQRFLYDPYGTVTVKDATWADTTDSYNWIYTFQGGRYDTTTGNYTFGARDYSIALQRWTQQDRAGYPDGPNAYEFVRDNPLTFLDPSGAAAKPVGNPTPQWGPLDVTGQPKFLPKLPGGRKWKPIPNDRYNPCDPESRPVKWVPDSPIPTDGKGGQPSGSWDPKYGHGDYDDGKGSPRQHFGKDGNPIPDDQAHPNPAPAPPATPPSPAPSPAPAPAPSPTSPPTNSPAPSLPSIPAPTPAQTATIALGATALIVAWEASKQAVAIGGAGETFGATLLLEFVP
jgi:RHS repeat-associated protein